MIDSINILKFLAILLIVNSHGSYFFSSYSFSFGGGLGNSLFYLLSGYTLALSQGKRPLPFKDWLSKRFLKIIIPFIIYIGFISIGNLQNFWSLITKHLIPHQIEQLYTFFPVLWLLYLIFIPVYSLKARYQAILLAILLICAGLGIAHIIGLENPIPEDIATYKMFFALNGLVCFLTGIILAKMVPILIQKIKSLQMLFAFFGFLSCQIIKVVVLTKFKFLIPFSFHLNLLSIILLFLACYQISFKSMPFIESWLEKLAKCSLAVFVIHFQMAMLIRTMDLAFPYNAVLLYLYSFLLAYPLTVIAGFISDYTVGFFMRKNRHVIPQ